MSMKKRENSKPTGGYQFLCVLFFVFLIMSVSAATALAVVSSESADSLILGDVNMDGNVNLVDAISTQKYSLGMIEFGEEQKLCGDVEKSGDINLLDSVLIQKFAVHMLTDTKGIGENISQQEPTEIPTEPPTEPTTLKPSLPSRVFEVDGVYFEGVIPESMVIDDSIYSDDWREWYYNMDKNCVYFRMLSTDANKEDIKFVVNNGNYSYCDDYTDPNCKWDWMYQDSQHFGYGCLVTDSNGEELAWVNAHFESIYLFEYRIDVESYPNIKGSFPIDIYYKDTLIKRINVTIDRSEHLENDPIFNDSPRIKQDVVNAEVRDFEKQCWKSEMNDKEKLDALAYYIMDNFTYAEFVCIDGAQDIAIAARDLGLESYLLYPGGEPHTAHDRYLYTYDLYGAVAQPSGHVAAVVKFKDGSLFRYDVDGDHCIIRNFDKPYK